MIGRRGQRWVRIAEIRDPQCQRCPLNNSTVNICVMGRGTSTARIMLVGEAPGEAESRTGKPFMGKAGQLLDSVLEENGMSGLVYITNICKCRPPQNRKPTDNERETCADTFLLKEIILLRPVVMVAMGKTATQFMQGTELWQRGQVYKTSFRTQTWPYILGTTVIPTWHPSYYLRSGSKVALDQMRSHLLKAKEIANAYLHQSPRARS